MYVDVYCVFCVDVYCVSVLYAHVYCVFWEDVYCVPVFCSCLRTASGALWEAAGGSVHECDSLPGANPAELSVHWMSSHSKI